MKSILTSKAIRGGRGKDEKDPEPVRKSGKIDNQVLSVVLESKKAVYRGGEEIFIRAKVSSRLNTVRIFLNGIPTESTNRTC